LEKISQKLIIV